MQDKEIELSVLNCAFMSKSAMTTLIESVDVNDFYHKDTQKIFLVLKRLYENNLHYDPILFLDKSKELNYNIDEIKKIIADIYIRVSVLNNIDSYINKLIKFSHKRKLALLAETINNELKQTIFDTDETINKIDTFLKSIPKKIDNTFMSSHEVFSNDIDYFFVKDTDYIKTGYQGIDDNIMGFFKSNLVIIAARPSQGKTALAINIARRQAERHNVLFFSLEQETKKVYLRMFSAESAINSIRIMKNNLSKEDVNILNEIKSDLKHLKIKVSQESGLHIDKLIYMVRKQHEINPVDIIFIDYLGLIGADKADRHLQLSGITKKLKMLAKELHIAIVVLSQLNRTIESRSNTKPMLSDLKECLSEETSLIYYDKTVQSNINCSKKVLTLNKSNNIAISDSTDILKGENIVYRIKTISGRFIDATGDHLVYTSLGYKQVKSLNTNYSLACAINSENWGNKNIDESKFIGWMLGNGCMYGYSVPSFITNDKIISDKFYDYINKKFGFYPKFQKHFRSKVYTWNCTKNSVRTSEGNPVTKWLKENDLWGRKSFDKYIPEWFLENADRNSVIELLKGLWETDGSICTGKRYAIKYSTTSYLLANQILYLLSKLGIFAYLNNGYKSKKATTKIYNIVVYDKEFINKFNTTIKLDGKKGTKQKLFKNYRYSYQSNLVGKECKEFLHSILKSNKIKNIRIQLKNNSLTKGYLKKIIPLIKIQNYELANKLSYLITENIVWDKIESIEKIGKVKVIDRNVPCTHNYIVNGFIVHNSGAIEEDADMVLFIWKPDQDQELARIVIAKNRDGLTADVDLKFEKKYTRFV